MLYIEDALPTVKYNGLNTQKATDLSGAPTVKLPAATTIAGNTVLTNLNPPIASGAATVQLTAAQSGGTFLFDAASGVAYTLPATPVAGMTFSFFVTVSVTSNAHSVAGASGSIFLLGAVNTVINASATTKAFAANGTSNYILSMNGSTTGGLQGTVLNLTALSATVWYVEGQIVGSGTLATPIT